MEDVPKPIIIKVKRKYTKKLKIPPPKILPKFPPLSAPKEATPPPSLPPQPTTIKINFSTDSHTARPTQNTSDATDSLRSSSTSFIILPRTNQ